MSDSTSIQEQKVPFGMKIGYGIGNFGGQFAYTTVGLFLMYFFTDVAMLSATLAGTLILITRFYDAFADLFMGYLADHTDTRWGQKRPYILFGAIPLGIAMYSMFLIPDLDSQGKFIYYLLTMLIFWSMFSIVTIPYNAMQPNLTQDANERSKVAGIYQFFTLIALIVIGGLTKPFTKSFPTERQGFEMMALIYGIIIAVSYLITFFTTRERFRPDNEDRYEIKQILSLLVKNRPFIILCVVACLVYTVFTVTGMMLNYFFKYNLKDEALVAVAFTAIFGVATLSIFFWVLLAQKIGKKKVFIAAMMLYGIVFFIMYFLNTTDKVVIIPLFVIAGIGFAGTNLGLWALVPDTVEYAQWKLGTRSEGVQYGFYNFIIKLATSIAGIIVGLGLDMTGYVANVAQTQSSLTGIRMMTSIIPFALIVLAILALLMYPITEEMHKKMCVEIHQKNC